MNDPLELLLADGVIDEVVSRLKSGKEADVWLVVHEGRLVAAKIYKERSSRNFKNNAGYTEGRRVRNSRTQRAIDKGSRFGQAAAEEAWKSAEADSLYKLHAAGVRVPTPVMFYEGVLLMELVTGADGHPAPRLIDAGIRPAEAAALYADLRAQVVKMLCCDLIHGDLSPYNVLLGAEGPTIIDFPQTIAAAANNQAACYFRRDLENLRHFFAGLDRSLHGRAGDAREIWRAYERRELTPDFEPREAPRPERPRREEEAPRAGQAYGGGRIDAPRSGGAGDAGIRFERPRRDDGGHPFGRRRDAAGERVDHSRRGEAGRRHDRPLRDDAGRRFDRVPREDGHRFDRPRPEGAGRGFDRPRREERGDRQGGARRPADRGPRRGKPAPAPLVVHVRRLGPPGGRPDDREQARQTDLPSAREAPVKVQRPG
ncbi:MAG TPA: RIO1 family regulatory kinase/ATPase [Vulgatibacter sp.]|nr:RIO1 family regulatory kinase/ATPase [Vulgatibacter sp.]